MAETTFGPLTERLLREVFRDSHHYAPGRQVTTGVYGKRSRTRRLMRSGRERARDLLERAAAWARFSHAHFDPAEAAARLARIIELSAGLESTYIHLGDDPSRAAMLDVLKLRVLGPFHAPLQITAEAYRRRQAYADTYLRSATATFHVSDPYFSPLSLYRLPVDGGGDVSLHSHSVDVVSVFLLDQYSYRHGVHQVTPRPGDVVLDIGGCWGDTALYFADRVGPEGRVYTFEFDPESLRILHANLDLNPQLASRIEVVPLALWSRSGEKLRFAQAGRMTHVSTDDVANLSGPTLTTVTVDDFVTERGLERVDFIKMDVEGAEMEVIAGAGKTIGRFASCLGIAAYHRDDDLATIPSALLATDSQYRFYLETFSPFEDETILFAASPRATPVRKRT